MATFTIKKFPDTLLAKLKKKATASRRSVTQEVLIRLEESLEKKAELASDAPSRDVSYSSEAGRQADAWELLAGRWKSGATVQEEIDALYKARSKGRKVNL